MSFLVWRAKIFAWFAHWSVKQQRRYTHEPYFHHLADVVAHLIIGANPSDEMIAAAFLHDSLEDVHWVRPWMLRLLFGRQVTNMVIALTDVYTRERMPEWKRAYRKRMEAKRLRMVHGDVQTIKYYDILSNTRTIVNDDPAFAETYLDEAELYLENMVSGHRSSRAYLLRHIAEKKAELEVVKAGIEARMKRRTKIIDESRSWRNKTVPGIAAPMAVSNTGT